jgi:hypothetical protein
MKRKNILTGVSIAAALAVLTTAAAVASYDKYTLKVPNGLAFAEFKGYESWEVIATSQSDKLVAVTLGNPAMIGAYKAGIPDNGKAFPDGAKMAKIHWKPKKNETAPGQPIVPGALHDVDFMVKDNKRFADSGGWGYAIFKFDTASDQFVPGTMADQPPQGNDAKCQRKPVDSIDCRVRKPADKVSSDRRSRTQLSSPSRFRARPGDQSPRHRARTYF